MKAYLAEEMGITSCEQLIERLKKAPKINMEIFSWKEEQQDVRGVSLRAVSQRMPE